MQSHASKMNQLEPGDPAHLGAHLEAVDGSRVLLQGNCSIGRSSKNRIVIKSERVSRNHAVVQAQDGGEYWLVDLGSTNGTYLNGNRVAHPTRLRDADKFEIGGVQHTFHQGELLGESDSTVGGGATMATLPEIRQRECWLMLTDIEGFTTLSQQIAPEKLAMIVGAWVKTGRELVEKHGGVVNKYLGDGYLSFWQDGPGMTEQIAAAGRELLALQTRSEPPFRVVLHRGLVAMGGSASLGEECLMGAEVNLLFRVEKLAGGLKVPFCLTAAAAEALANHLPAQEVEGDHKVKGFDASVRIYWVNGATLP